MSCKSLDLIIYTGGLGLFICLVSSYVGWTAYPFFTTQHIKLSISLTDGSRALNAMYVTQKWEFNVYVFNVTNPEDISQGGMAILQELGPYVYDLYKSKVDIDLTNNDTLSFRVESKFYFNSNKSGENKETDVITTVNVPLLEIAYSWEENKKFSLNSTISYLLGENQNLFMDVPVGDLLFNGIELKCGNKTDSLMLECDKIYNDLFSSYSEIPGTRDFAFSYFQKVNSSLSEAFQVYRGTNNIAGLGKVVTHGGYTYLKMWERGTPCGKLKGTDGSIFPPMNPANERELHFYTPELCMYARYYRIQKEKDVDNTLHFGLSETNFVSPEKKKEYTCRCKKNKKDSSGSQQCTEDGVIEATNCYGEPFVYSYPRFLYSDYKINLTNVDDPSFFGKSKIIIEPRTGIPLEIKKKIQKNIFLKQLEFPPFANVSKQLFPLCWTKEQYSHRLPQYYLNELTNLQKMDTIVMTVCWLLLGASSLLLLTSYFLWFKHDKESRKESSIPWQGINKRRKGHYFQ